MRKRLPEASLQSRCGGGSGGGGGGGGGGGDTGAADGRSSGRGGQPARDDKLLSKNPHGHSPD